MKENIEEVQKKYIKDINEAIKVYEEFRRFKNDDFIESIDPDFLFNLTDVILSDYKRLQEEFKQVDHECERLEQKELRLEKENEELKEKWDKDTHKLQNDLDIANAERIDWEKAYQEEKDKQDELALHIITLVKKVNNSIPKQKIKDKIEELKKWIYTGKNAPQDFLQYRIKAKIQVLQDLLEEKGE